MFRVLVVDDSAFMRRLIRNALAKGNYSVIAEAANGTQALFYAELLKPDIVTLDLVMSDMKGISVLKKIRKKRPQTRVVVISSMGQKEVIIDAINAGASGFVIKPFDAEGLLQEMNKALRPDKAL